MTDNLVDRSLRLAQEYEHETILTEVIENHQRHH